MRENSAAETILPAISKRLFGFFERGELLGLRRDFFHEDGFALGERFGIVGETGAESTGEVPIVLIRCCRSDVNAQINGNRRNRIPNFPDFPIR